MLGTSHSRLVRASTDRAFPGRSSDGSYRSSTRSHGMSCRQNVLRCIFIAVMVGAAFWAIPLTHGQRKPFQDVSTFRASLARWEKPVNLLQRLVVPVALVGEQRSERSERGIGNSAGKGVVLDHAAHVQILDADRVEATNQIGRNLVHVVEAGVRDLGVNLGHAEPSALPAPAAPDPPGKGALRSGQFLCSFGKMPRIRDALTIRERGEPVDAEVYADRLLGLGHLKALLVENQGHEVATDLIFRDRGRGRITFEVPGPANPQPSDPRDMQVAVLWIPLEPASCVLRSLRPVLFLKRWVAAPLLKEVSERRLKVPECLLRRHAGDLGQPGVVFLPLEFGKRSRTGVVVDGLSATVAVGAESERPVIHVSASSERSSQNALLFRSWVEAVSVAQFHKSNYTLVSGRMQGGNHVPLSLKSDSLPWRI